MTAATASSVLPDTASAHGTVGEVLESLAAASGSQDLARTVARTLQGLLHARVSVSAAGAFRSELGGVVDTAVRLPLALHGQRVTGRGRGPRALLVGGTPRRRTPHYLLWRGTEFTPDELALVDGLALTVVALHLRWEAVELEAQPRPLVAAPPGEATALTSREAFVLEHLARGLSADGIARLGGISPRTVRKHLQHVYAKLGTHDRLVAVEAARRSGLLGARTPGPPPA